MRGLGRVMVVLREMGEMMRRMTAEVRVSALHLRRLSAGVSYHSRAFRLLSMLKLGEARVAEGIPSAP